MDTTVILSPQDFVTNVCMYVLGIEGPVSRLDLTLDETRIPRCTCKRSDLFDIYLHDLLPDEAVSLNCIHVCVTVLDQYVFLLDLQFDEVIISLVAGCRSS